MCDDRRLQRLVGLLALPVHARIGDLARGTGLAGLKDRVEAIGGRIIQHSPPGPNASAKRCRWVRLLICTHVASARPTHHHDKSCAPSSPFACDIHWRASAVFVTQVGGTG